MNKILMVIGVTILLAGCAATKQAITDYNTGKTTPIQANEVAPSTEAATIGNTIGSLPIPFAAPIGLGVTFLAGIFLTWKRGQSIRKTGVPSVTTTNTVSLFTGIEQILANVFTGAFTMAPTTGTTVAGSVWQRVWKVALATLASGATVAAASPTVMTFLTGHPVLDALFVSVSSGIAGIEKALSNVPTVTASTSTTVSA